MEDVLRDTEVRNEIPNEIMKTFMCTFLFYKINNTTIQMNDSVYLLKQKCGERTINFRLPFFAL